MFLKRLEIYGFKSFGTKSTLDFENEQIAGIVGPNGSGKSNIADAIRWVLGEQSTNLLRSKKGEDVVFVGSQKKARSSYAEVSLNLSGSSEVEVEIAGRKHSFRDIEISRKIYRSGESEYSINRKKVRLIDLQTLLASLGFGQSSYTVIGQGMVDRLLFFNAAERRVLFDEAAGVKQYKIKRGQAIKRLETTEENLIRLKDINQELTPRVQNLRRLVKKAEGRMETEKELHETEQKYFGSIKGELIENISKLNLQKGALVSKIQYIESEKKTVTSSEEVSAPEGLAEKIKTVEREITSKLRDRDEFLKEIAFIEGQIREQENIFYNLKNNQQALTKEAEREKEEVILLTKKLSDKKKEAAGLNESIQKLETTLEKFEIQRQESQDDNQNVELENEKNNLGKHLNQLEEKYRWQQENIDNERNKKLNLAKDIADIKNRLKDKNSEKTKMSFLQEKIDQDINQYGRKSDSFLAGIKAIEAEILESRERIIPSSIVSFKKELNALEEAHSDFGNQVQRGAKNLKDIFTTFSAKFNKILKLAKGISEAIDPEKRNELEKKLTNARDGYLEVQRLLSEKAAENERAKQKIIILEHEISHLESMIKEKTLAGEKIQLIAINYSQEISKIKDKLAKVTTELTVSHKKQQDENTSFAGKVEETKNSLYEARLREAQNNGEIKNAEKELAQMEKKLLETEALLTRTQQEKFDNDPSDRLDKKRTGFLILEKEIDSLRSILATFSDDFRAIEGKSLEREKAIHQLDKEEGVIQGQINEIELEKARLETKQEAINEEMKTFRIEATARSGIMNQNEKDVMRARIENLRRKRDSIAGVDPETVQEYEESEKRLSDLVSQVGDLEKAEEDLRTLVKELDRKITTQFSNTFKEIAERFQKYFSLLFEGGRAELILGEDEAGELGVEIKVNPPGKKVQTLSMLSGGERTLTSLALVFAILSINPSPFCVLDEVDAALDEANTTKFVKILKELDKKTQFLIITHNRETMKVAHYLYGLTMNEEHISKLFSIKLTEAYIVAKST